MKKSTLKLPRHLPIGFVGRFPDDVFDPADLGARNEPNIVYAANEARFTSVNYSEPLTQYVTGWRNPSLDLAALLEECFPQVEVGRRFEFKQSVNAEAFLSEADDIRAIGSGFKRVEYTGTTVNQKTLNKGLTIRIDQDDQFGDMWQEQAAGRLKDRLLRNELRRGFALLEAAATTNSSLWNADTVPDKDLRDRLRAAKNTSGLRPNRVIYTDDAFDLRADAYEAAARENAGSLRAADAAPGELAAKLRVDSVKVMGEIYQSGASAKSLLMTELCVLMYMAISGASKDDPSNVKRFVTPTGAGGGFRTYVKEHEKFTDISVEHYANTVITYTGGIEKLTVAAA